MTAITGEFIAASIVLIVIVLFAPRSDKWFLRRP